MRIIARALWLPPPGFQSRSSNKVVESVPRSHPTTSADDRAARPYCIEECGNPGRGRLAKTKDQGCWFSEPLHHPKLAPALRLMNTLFTASLAKTPLPSIIYHGRSRLVAKLSSTVLSGHQANKSGVAKCRKLSYCCPTVHAHYRETQKRCSSALHGHRPLIYRTQNMYSSPRGTYEDVPRQSIARGADPSRLPGRLLAALDGDKFPQIGGAFRAEPRFGAIIMKLCPYRDGSVFWGFSWHLRLRMGAEAASAFSAALAPGFFWH